jgi:DivIVA domain-containing protein
MQGVGLPWFAIGAVILVALVVFALAAVLTDRVGTPDPETVVDAADDGLPDGPLLPGDLARLRFGLAARGYRMAEVDAFVDRVAAELAWRDAEIARLRGDGPGFEQSLTDGGEAFDSERR